MGGSGASSGLLLSDATGDAASGVASGGDEWWTIDRFAQRYVGRPLATPAPTSAVALQVGVGFAQSNRLTRQRTQLRWEYTRALLRERAVEHRKRALALLTRQYRALRNSRRMKRAGALVVCRR